MLFRVKVMEGGGEEKRGRMALKIKEEHAHQPGQLVQLEPAQVAVCFVGALMLWK